MTNKVNTRPNDTINTFEILQNLFSNDTINMSNIQEHLELMKNQEFLSQHKYKIWEGSDGRWYTYFPDEEKGRVLRSSLSEDKLNKKIIKFYKDKKEQPTVKEMFEDWVARKFNNGEISKPTYDRYIQDYNRYFTKISNKRVSTITEIDLEDWIKQTIHDLKLTNKAYSNMRTLIYGIFRNAKRHKLIEYSIKSVVDDMEISPRLFTHNEKKQEDQVFTEDELPIAINYLEMNLDIMNLGLLLMFKTGVRVGELATLKKEDFIDSGIQIKRTETRYKNAEGHDSYHIKEFPKTPAGYRHVLIAEKNLWIINEIQKLNPDGIYMFEKNNKRIKTYQFRNRLEYVCKAIKIKNKSPHKARKTCASILIDSHVPESIIIEQIGHTKIDTTKKHYYFNRHSNETKQKILGSVKDI